MAQKSRLRVGSVSFLNPKPLVYTLENQSPPDNAIELSFEVPSRLADQLKRGDIDVGLIPVIEYFRPTKPSKGHPYQMIPHISVASRGQVLSIQLFSHVPIPAIRRVALDTNSRTSRALVQIVLAEKYNVFPEFTPCDPSVHPATVTDVDAVLLIGDSALRRLGSTEIALDLGEEWTNFTGLPFVYACWVARTGVHLGDLPQRLLDAKKRGIDRIPEIARVESTKLKLPEKLCRDYLAKHICYDFGSEEIAGLKKFYEFAVKHQLATPDIPLQFVK